MITPESHSELCQTSMIESNIYDCFHITIPFKKRTRVLINGFEYDETTMQKQEKTEFYNY